MKKKVILTIDQGSLNMGGCVIDFEDFIKEDKEFNVIETKQVKLCNTVNRLGSERINNFEKEILYVKNKYEVIEVVIEQPQLIRGYQGRSVINGKAYRLLGTIGLVLKHFDGVWECQNNSGYSKIFNMGRRNDRSELRKTKARNLSADFIDKEFEEIGEDECDAICIAFWGFTFGDAYRTKKIVNNVKMLLRYKTDTNSDYYQKMGKEIEKEKERIKEVKKSNE